MVRRLQLRYQRPRLRQEIILTIYNNVIRSKGVSWVHLAQDSKKKGRSCKHSNEPSDL